MTILARNSVRFALFSSITMAMFTFTVLSVLANYMACNTSFERLGYEAQPLSSDSFIGQIAGDVLGTFMPEATISNLYAFIVAAGIAFGLFFVTHFLFECYHDISRMLDTMGNPEEHRAWRQELIKDALYILLLGIPLGFAINWDLDLFRLRSAIALAELGADVNPATTTQIQSFAGLQQAHQDQAAYNLSFVGAWGYLGVTALLCLGLEASMRKTGECWTNLATPVETWIQQQVENMRMEDELVEEEVQETAEASLAGEALPEPIAQQATSAPITGETQPAIPGEPQVVSDIETPAKVIGSATEEEVLPSKAIRNPDKYHVDPNTKEVWDRKYWTEVNKN